MLMRAFIISIMSQIEHSNAHHVIKILIFLMFLEKTQNKFKVVTWNYM